MNYRKQHIKPKIKRIRKERKHIGKRLWFWLGILACVAVLVGGYVFLFSRAFAVEHVTVSGNHEVDSQNISAAVWREVNIPIFHLGRLLISTNSILLANKQKIAQAALKTSAQISSVSVQKQFPHDISVAVTERNPVAVFCNANNQCFAMDQTGIIFQSADPQGMLAIRDDLVNGQVVGQQVIPASIMSDILQTQKNLNDNFQIGLNAAVVSNNLELDTSEGWKAYVDPESDVKAQLKKLDALLENQITPDMRKHLQYIYLQYPDRAYYQ